MKIDQMNCVVTGAGSTVGKAAVQALLKEGATVVGILHGETSSLMEMGPKHYTVKGDLVDVTGVQAIVDSVLNRLGTVHGWINAVGGFRMGPTVEEASTDDWKHMLSINFITALNCCQTILPHMKEQRFGRIINFGSYPGEDGMAQAAPYAVSKGAVHILTKSMAQEGKEFNILPMALLPVTIDTPENRASMPDADWSQWLQPEDVANAIVDLLSNGKMSMDTETVLFPLEPQRPAPSESEPQSDDILSVFEPEPEAEPLVSEEVGTEAPEDQTTPSPPIPRGVSSTSLLQYLNDENEDKEKAQSEAGIPDSEETPEEVNVPHAEEPQPQEEEPEPEKETEAEEKSQPIDPEMASFSMVIHLKTRGLYDQALEMLSALELKGEDPDRIQQEKMEIEEFIGTEQEDQVEGTEPPGDQPVVAEETVYDQETTEAELQEESGEILEHSQEQLESPVEESDAQNEEPEPGIANQDTTDIQEPVIEGAESILKTEPPEDGQEQTIGVDQGQAGAEGSDSDASPEPVEEEEVTQEKEPEKEPEPEKELEAVAGESESTGKEKPETAKKKKLRPTTTILLVIFYLIFGYAILYLLGPDISLLQWLIPGGSEDEPATELALSEFHLTAGSPGALMGETQGVDFQSDAGDDEQTQMESPTTIIQDSVTEENAGINPEVGESSVSDTAMDVSADTETQEMQETGLPEIQGDEETLPASVIPAGETELPDTIEMDQEAGIAPAIMDSRDINRDVWDMFHQGDYQAAARLWRTQKEAHREGYTIVLEFACLNVTVRNAWEALDQSEDFYLLPINLQERDCFIFCWGDYPDEASALEQFQNVPAWFEENGASPVVRALAKLLR